MTKVQGPRRLEAAKVVLPSLTVAEKVLEQVHRIRKFVEEHGRLGAIARLDHEERRLVEIVAGYGSDEDVGIPSFLYSGWCLTTLPHSRIPDEDPWEVSNGNLTSLVEPGRRVKQG